MRAPAIDNVPYLFYAVNSSSVNSGNEANKRMALARSAALTRTNEVLRFVPR